MSDIAAKLRELAATALRAGKPIEITAEQLLALVEGMTAVDVSIVALRAEVDDVRRRFEHAAKALAERDVEVARLRAEVERLTGAGFAAMNPATVADVLDNLAARNRQLAIVEPVFEASLALRRSESRAALASDVIAEIEAERALTDAQVEARSHAALTRWRTVVDAALHIEAAKERTDG